jgi:HAMP domain-containing protein
VGPLKRFRTKFRASRVTLPAAAIATAISALCLLAIWFERPDGQDEMDRYGQALATTLADTTAPELLNKQRITLTVIANRLNTLEEVAGIAFYGADDELMALSGVQRSDADYRAQATIDNTPSGSVTVSLARERFAPATPWSRLLLSVLTLLLTPPITVMVIQFSTRGNRSLPIVSVPSEPAQEQPAYLLTVKLHNQRSLNRQEQRQAIDDALTMGREVCALYPGFALTLQERGLALLISKAEASSLNALYASFLLQRLLTEYETQGEFRCMLSTVISPKDPAEAMSISTSTLKDITDLEQNLTLASLAKADTALMTAEIFEELNDDQRQWAATFAHPVLEDLAPNASFYSVGSLPQEQEKLITEQARVVLGFNLGG